MTLPKYQTELLKAADYEAYLPFLEVAFACKFFSSGRNEDFQHILATLANISLDFLKENPWASLYAEGSTPARTRLYQREITRHYHLVPENLQVYGLVKDNEVGFIEFQTGVNFDAFLLSMK